VGTGPSCEHFLKKRKDRIPRERPKRQIENVAGHVHGIYWKKQVTVNTPLAPVLGEVRFKHKIVTF
jgi:hypothetical protein